MFIEKEESLSWRVGFFDDTLYSIPSGYAIVALSDTNYKCLYDGKIFKGSMSLDKAKSICESHSRKINV